VVRIEVAVTTVEEARAAVGAGAARLELCSHLEVGGVTPPRDVFLAIREAVAVPICVLVRPRAGNIVYSDAEFEMLIRDADWFHREGAIVVSGVLNPDGNVDRDRCAKLPRGSVFHRAFDEVPDHFAAMEMLIELGFRRILTSGGAATAPEGAVELAALIRAAGSRIEILPGGGITPDNVAELVRRTGATWIHGSFRCGKPATDADAIRETRICLTAHEQAGIVV
jgi:copper homeostasis protein CutC